MGIASLLILISSAASPPPLATAFGADDLLARSSAAGTATVRILIPVVIGEGLAPEGLTPRVTALPLPDGRAQPIRLYEFE
jgi:hypothetical protein